MPGASRTVQLARHREIGRASPREVSVTALSYRIQTRPGSARHAGSKLLPRSGSLAGGMRSPMVFPQCPSIAR